MKEHISILISGKVQGVFFRASAKEKADELGIVGFVTNQPNGSVYIEAEGNKEQLNDLKTWCQTGPRRAQVDSVEIKEGELQHFLQFNILR
ncbi:MAG: acylphosphatase [Marivirga sp.]|nr:acylphosphatase [Marivirga sp.]